MVTKRAPKRASVKLDLRILTRSPAHALRTIPTSQARVREISRRQAMPQRGNAGPTARTHRRASPHAPLPFEPLSSRAHLPGDYSPFPNLPPRPPCSAFRPAPAPPPAHAQCHPRVATSGRNCRATFSPRPVPRTPETLGSTREATGCLPRSLRAHTDPRRQSSASVPPWSPSRSPSASI